MIASHLDAPSLARYRLVSKSLCTWTPKPPKLKRKEWQVFNQEFENIRRRGKAQAEGRLLSLACSKCDKVFASELFSDKQARRSFGANRMCVTCQTRSWGKRSRNFAINGVEHFGCVGCLQAKILGEEDVEPLRYGKYTFALSFLSDGYRWCLGCSRPLRNLQWVKHGWWQR